jgi:hypothetical protein
MEARISIVTLGVEDLPRAIAFYRDGLGLPMINDGEGVAFFELHGLRLALYPRGELAADAGVEDRGRQPFSGIALAHNLPSTGEVDALLAHVATMRGSLRVYLGRLEDLGYTCASETRNFRSSRCPGNPARPLS